MSCKDCGAFNQNGRFTDKRFMDKQGKECRRMLLMGNPNVGKSVFFSRLTGVHAISSNYPGTTVGFTEGMLRSGSHCAYLIDVPGAYTLEPTNEAEEIAKRIIGEGADLVILVLDATALERNLVLCLQVLERNIPVIVALNMVDEARHCGIVIDAEALERELGVPVIQTVAVTGVGISELVDSLDKGRTGHFSPMSKAERWQKIGEIVSAVQTVTHRHHTLRDRLEDFSVHPLWGGVLGIFILSLCFILIRFIGEGIIANITDPLFEGFYMPLLEKISGLLGGGGFLHNILIGKTFGGVIDLEQSLGVLSTGIYVEFGMVLPYIVAFYSILGFLEDLGYLPRLAVVFDALMHRFGIHGYAIIPTLLGLGCNVPGILATRVLESERERFITATLISVGIPCVSIQAMLTATLAQFGMRYIAAVYLILFTVWLILGRLMHLTLKGFSPELIVEIPPYRLPTAGPWANKLWFRVRDFLVEATPLVLGGILLVNLLDAAGLMDSMARALSPVFQGALGLPSAAAVPIVMGLFRKDIAMGLLIPLGLDARQMLTAVVMLAMTFPCIATFVVLWKELGAKRMLQSSVIMIGAAFATGTLMRVVFALTG